jgi:hypothetical protein
MTSRDLTATGVRPVPVLVLVAVLISVASCTKHDSLVLLELRSSGPLGAPVVSIRLSASGWPTRTVPGSIGPEGLRLGYYGPGDGKAVTVKAEALDGANCVLGIGSAGVPRLEAGATSAPTTLFVRPQPGNDCAFDAGTGDSDAGDSDAGGPDTDDAAAGEADSGSDAGSDLAPDDADPDADLDAGAPDASDD